MHTQNPMAIKYFVNCIKFAGLCMSTLVWGKKIQIVAVQTRMQRQGGNLPKKRTNTVLFILMPLLPIGRTEKRRKQSMARRAEGIARPRYQRNSQLAQSRSQ